MQVTPDRLGARDSTSVRGLARDLLDLGKRDRAARRDWGLSTHEEGNRVRAAYNLARYFTKGGHRGIPAQFGSRIERMLDRLDASVTPAAMDVPGYRFHPLKGKRAGEFAVSVSGNWRITFRFDGEDATDVNLENYH